MWQPSSECFEEGTWDWLYIVHSVIGWGMTSWPKAFKELIAPIESKAMQDSMVRMSTCALVVRGLLRCYGLDDAELWQPYRIGHAVSDVVAIAKRHNAWRGPDSVFGVGDVVLVGSSSNPVKWGGGEHMFVVTGIDHGEATSVDGGQLDDHGKQCILERTRTISMVDAALRVGSRRVAGVLQMGNVVPTMAQYKPTRNHPG